MASEYEREIEDILRNMGELGPKRRQNQRLIARLGRAWRRFTGWLGGLPSAFAADQLMMAAIICVVAAFFMRFVFPAGARWVGLAAGALFVAALALSIRQVWGHGGGSEKRWRGRVIDMQSGQPTLADRLILWFRRRKYRR
jgi:hypothetical protein